MNPYGSIHTGILCNLALRQLFGQIFGRFFNPIELPPRASFFRETVHDPVMTTIKLRNAKYAVHVQKLCGKAHLETFVCEDIADMHTLTNKLRKERKLRKINAAHSVADPR